MAKSSLVSPWRPARRARYLMGIKTPAVSKRESGLDFRNTTELPGNGHTLAQLDVAMFQVRQLSEGGVWLESRPLRIALPLIVKSSRLTNENRKHGSGLYSPVVQLDLFRRTPPQKSRERASETSTHTERESSYSAPTIRSWDIISNLRLRHPGVGGCIQELC